VVLVGEAPGKRGARWTGVPFTSPFLLHGSGPSEPTATVVHRVLAELGCESEVLCWNASVLFPPDNRDPRRAELEASAPALERVCRGRTVLAVGRLAQRATGAPYLRHPSYGGATRFADGLRHALGRHPSPGGSTVDVEEVR
jgi:uracil-DNA glycosylase